MAILKEVLPHRKQRRVCDAAESHRVIFYKLKNVLPVLGVHEPVVPNVKGRFGVSVGTGTVIAGMCRVKPEAMSKADSRAMMVRLMGGNPQGASQLVHGKKVWHPRYS